MSEHEVWDASSEACEKAPGKQGCIRRHPKGMRKDLLKGPCDYQWNSFSICKGARSSAYEQNAREGKSYLDVANSLNMVDERAETVATREGQGKSTSDAHRFFQMHFASPVAILRDDPDAWNIRHTVGARDLPKWAQRRWPGVTNENFLPRAHDGFGSMIPYHHNHHHLIPNGAFRDAVILGPGLGQTKGDREMTAYWRICVVRMSKYNINEEKNLAILPQQVSVSKVVGLPAHCPYGRVNHKAYSDMVKTELETVRETVDDAIGASADHEALQEISLILGGLEGQLWTRVRDIEPVGSQIGT